MGRARLKPKEVFYLSTLRNDGWICDQMDCEFAGWYAFCIVAHLSRRKTYRWTTPFNFEEVCRIQFCQDRVTTDKFKERFLRPCVRKGYYTVNDKFITKLTRENEPRELQVSAARILLRNAFPDEFQ